MRVHFCAALVFILASPVLAGGDYVLARIESFSENAGAYSIKLVRTDNRIELMNGCKDFEVHLRYRRVPRFSWLPFARSGHPTKQQTVEAVSNLEKGHLEQREVYFGHIGFGLAATDHPCVFESKGLT
jgi:hypothetical protein